MVGSRRVAKEKSCFTPDETAALKLAYNDAVGKLEAARAGPGSRETVASEIIKLGRLRADLGQAISGHSDAQLLSFLARQALK